MEKYNEQKLSNLIKDLNQELQSPEMEVDDSGAYEIALGILDEEKGLKEYLTKTKGIKDPVGWLADRI
jgi:hypothetical protein